MAGPITPAQLDSMLAQTRRLRAGFAPTAARRWDAATAATELAVQLGHLAQCVRRDHLAEPVPIDKDRPISDLGDELADVVLSILSVWTLSSGASRDQELHAAMARRRSAASGAGAAAALLRIVSEAGALAEIAMIDCGYRHRPGGVIVSLADAVANALDACRSFGRDCRLDIVAEFARMVGDADGFLASRQAQGSRPGQFSTHERAGPRVIKRLAADHLTGRALFIRSQDDGRAALRRYLEVIRAGGVRLPDGLTVLDEAPISVAHRWIDAPTLPEIAASDPAGMACAVEQIAGWVRALDRTDARIDTNLANFCLVDGAPMLIDVLPPLIVSNRPASRNLFEELFDSLCFDTPVTLDALLGYALKTLLVSHNDQEATRGLTGLAEVLLSGPAHPGLGGFWFRARLRLGARCAAGRASLAELDAFSALTSVLTFQRLDEHARHQRVAAVRHRIRELDLGET